MQGGICARDQWGGDNYLNLAVGGKKHPCLGWAVKKQWGG